MYIEDLQNYTDERINNGLTKFEVKTESDEMGHLIVVKTKEEYVFLSEDEADDLINEARQDRLFLSAKKKFKEGKISKKTQEIVTPESWHVILELGH